MVRRSKRDNHSNEWYWVKVVYSTIFDSDGVPLYALGTSVDVTEEKNAQIRYQEEMNYRKSLGENIIATHCINLTKGIVEESKSLIHKVDLPRNSIINNEIFRKICDESIPNIEERENYYNRFNPIKMLEDYREGITYLEMRYRAKMANDELKWVHLRVRLMKQPDSGDTIAFFNTWDINERKLTNDVINAVVELDYDYLMHINPLDKKFTLFSGRTGTRIPPNAMGDYDEERLNNCKTYVIKEDRKRCNKEMSIEYVKEHLKNQKTFVTYIRILENDGRISRKRLTFSYLGEKKEDIFLARVDVTNFYEEEQRKNDALLAALTAAEQANAAKRDFLSRMSHEIRTPMNAIIGMSTIAAQSIGDDEQTADCISKIGISSRFLLSLINDILDMSRIESGKILLKSEKIPFEEFVNGINDICYSQAQSKDIDYDCVVDYNMEDYYIGDAMKLQQVIINILSNAIKFTDKGKVSMHIHQVRKTKHDAIIRFVINDTGCGISDEFLPKLFEPFAQEHGGTTTMYGGTGLGLSICKNLVDLMDGNITVRSIVGVGSEFNVQLKLGITEETKKHAIRKMQVNFEKIKVLVVDDDVAVCEHADIVLKDMGIKSEWVDRGIKAIERVREKWSKQEFYDIIFIDWKMPEMDGIETARQVRKIVGPDVTIIIMTAYDWIAIEREAKLAGVNMLMSKPMFKSSLVSVFEKTFGQKDEEVKDDTPEDFDFTGKRVLLAEDHPLNVEVATRLLERKGFKVDNAENGVRAVEMFTIASEGFYDAILMDIRMPIMDGLQATRAIRHLSKKEAETIPIIAMTANAFDEDIEKSKQAGMNAHLAKPIEPNQLYHTLYDYINGD